MNTSFKKFIGIMVMVGITTMLNAQVGYFNEALLFSNINQTGTARISSLGGAQVALGGDVSLAGTNPAGLGFFNRSTLTFSSGINISEATSGFNGDDTRSYRTRFIIPQAGIVFNNNKGDVLPDNFKGGSFAIGFQRVNDFNSDIEYVGRNSNSSVVDAFILNAGLAFPDELAGLEGTAYDHFLIDEADYDTNDRFLFSSANGNDYVSPNIEDGTIEGYESVLGSFYGSLPEQTERITTSGGQHVMNVAWGGNYKDVFYFGAGAGLHFLNYERVRRYEERDFQLSDGTSDPLINSIRIRDRLSIEGSGFSANIGLIARPLPFMTIGASYQTPTFYLINEETDFVFTTDWSDNAFYISDLDANGTADTTQLGFISTESDIAISDYSLRTPGRLQLGTAFFFGKRGFITGQVEFVDYTSALLRSSDVEVFDDNIAIVTNYRNVINYRFGAEIRFDEFRVRGGYNLQQDPFTDRLVDRSINTFSGGVGYRNKDFFVDLSTSVSKTNQLYSPYFIPQDNGEVSSPEVRTAMQGISSMLTIGTTF
jgi:hypothetical protein